MLRKSGQRSLSLFLLVVPLFLSSLSPAFAAWTTPVELRSTEDSIIDSDAAFLSMPSLTVQEDGVAHVIYIEKTGKTYSVIHQTNLTGSWQKETVASSTKRLETPAAAVYGRRLYLAWTQGAGRASEIISATNAGGAWSTSRMTANSAKDANPSIAVRRGKVYISWIRAARTSAGGWVVAGAVYVKTNRSGRWRTKRIGEQYFGPSAPVVKIDGAGAAHVVYSAMTELDGDSFIVHADNAAGKWREERLPVNKDGNGKNVSAMTPALALYKKAVYVAYMKVSAEAPDGRLVLAVKKSGSWRVKVLAKSSTMAAIDGPRIAAGKGRVKVAYSRLAFALDGTVKTQVRYVELVHGRKRAELIDSEVITMDSTATTLPPYKLFMVTGFDDVRGVVHAAYLRLTLWFTGDFQPEKVNTQLMYSRRDP